MRNAHLTSCMVYFLKNNFEGDVSEIRNFCETTLKNGVNISSVTSTLSRGSNNVKTTIKNKFILFTRVNSKYRLMDPNSKIVNEHVNIIKDNYITYNKPVTSTPNISDLNIVLNKRDYLDEKQLQLVIDVYQSTLNRIKNNR